ncbi:MAG: hypothetical protein R3244_01600 [Thermoanaerobaculia bacterium]|nr:hypothetical protein [Thermoanaerobaculia bacterium]
MPYSVMIWLVDAENGNSTEADSGRDNDGQAGVTAPPRFSHLAYGLYDDRQELREALARLTNELGEKGVVRVEHGSRTFLVPTERVHYVVAEEVERPVDRSE